MKPVMTHPSTNFLRIEDVTYPLRADLALLDHFRSTGALSPYAIPNPATHHHHIPYSPELSWIAPIHSGS
jgi:hypothetical protein